MEYGLIGGALGHSFSPFIHARFARYNYTLCELPPEDLAAFLSAGQFSGLNVTMPYKEAVIPHLDWLDDSAAAIGAVNTVVRRGGRLLGYNTDFGGMLSMLSRAEIDLRGKKVLILGTGGAAKTAQAVARHCGATEILPVSRTDKPGAVTYDAALRDHADARILINATPVGMYPNLDEMPIDPAAFPLLEGVADLIYNPLHTRLCLEAARRGVRTCNGLFMLVRQAALACALFTGQPVPAPQTEEIYRSLLTAQENLVLIGMPGSGKTTVGRLLAQKLGRVFIDTDEEISKTTGTPVQTLLTACGEPHFRSLEAELVRALADRQGCVIATGGGTVLAPENVRRLRQNGRLVFLDRPLEQLTATDRHPLSDTPEKLRRLYEARHGLYLAAADDAVRLAAAADPADYAAAILKNFS